MLYKIKLTSTRIELVVLLFLGGVLEAIYLSVWWKTTNSHLRRGFLFERSSTPDVVWMFSIKRLSYRSINCGKLHVSMQYSDYEVRHTM